MESVDSASARRGLVVFWLVAFALPWTVWGTTIAQQRGWLAWHLPQSLAFWIGLPVAWVAGSLAGEGPPALRALVGRLLRWNVAPRWYLAAVGLAVALPLAGLVPVLAGGMALPAGGAGPAGEPLPPAGIPLALAVEVALFWLTEEAAWRGFAQPGFERWLPPEVASLAVGVLWALWHLPLFAITGSFQSGLPYVGFFVLTCATSVILGWLFHRGRSSVPLCAVYHGAVDVTFAATGVLTASPASFWTVVALHVALAAALWWRGVLPRGRQAS